MKNNLGKGLYEIGEMYSMPCGCIGRAEVHGYTHFVHPKCQFDKGFKVEISSYRYKEWSNAAYDKMIAQFTKEVA